MFNLMFKLYCFINKSNYKFSNLNDFILVCLINNALFFTYKYDYC